MTSPAGPAGSRSEPGGSATAMTPRVESPSDDAWLGPLTSLVGPPRGRWGQRLATTAAAYTVGHKAWTWAQQRRRQRSYTIAVYDTDALYRPVQEWVLDQMPPEAQRALIAKTDRHHDTTGPRGAAEIVVQRRLELYFDGTRAQDVVLDGHRIQVVIERDASTATDRANDETKSAMSWRPARIVFDARTLPGEEAVIRFLGRLNDQLAADKYPSLYTLGRWGEWHSSRMRPRPLDSVILADGQLERIISDLQAFYASEARYTELGIPWHRGYLFAGPPGTGKTSTVRAIAGHLNLDMYYVPLSDVRADADLPRVLSGLSGRAVLLLEDVDVYEAARERDDTGEGLTASGLLNALDGVITPHGLVTVMTTNRIETLEPALVRPGRADLIEEMGYLDDDQFVRLLRRMLLRRATGPLNLNLPSVEDRRVSPADVIEVVKRHLDDPGGAIPEITRMIAGRLVEHERVPA
jgi:hypothetical protein